VIDKRRARLPGSAGTSARASIVRPYSYLTACIPIYCVREPIGSPVLWFGLVSFLPSADPLTARAVARQLAALLPYVAAESGLDLLSPYFCDDAGDLTEIVNMEAGARIHAETFGESDGLPFYFHLIEALGLVSVPTFHPRIGDGPWLVGDGIDLWSASNEITARMVAAAIDVAGMDPYVECFALY